MKRFVYTWDAVRAFDKNLILRAYTIDHEGKTIIVNIEGYKPCLYVEMPTSSSIEFQEKIIEWGEEQQGVFFADVVFKKNLYNLHLDDNGKDILFPFLKLEFTKYGDFTQFTMNNAGKAVDIYGKRIILKLHETHLHLEIVAKFLATTCFPPTGWIDINTKSPIYPPNKSCTFYSTKCDISEITVVSNDDTIVEPYVASFDIEANSSNINSMPNALIEDDRIFLISVVGVNSKHTKKNIFCLAELDDHILDEGTIVHKCKNEQELLLRFAEHVRIENYNILIGYNILSWDFEYIYNRSLQTKVGEQGVFPRFGCYPNMTDKIADVRTNARINQKSTYINPAGRLIIDLLPIIRKNYSFMNYKLGTVTKELGLPTKNPLTHLDIFAGYRESNSGDNRKISEVAKYCVQDSHITYLLYKKLSIWQGLCEMAKVVQLPIFEAYISGNQLQFVAQALRYCIENNIMMTSPKEIDMNREHKSSTSGSSDALDKYMGATILDPSAGLHDKVVSFDFASLYPSIMIAYNIDYQTYIDDKVFIIGVHNAGLLFDSMKNNNNSTTLNVKFPFNFPCYIKQKQSKRIVSDEIEQWIKVETIQEIKSIVDKTLSEVVIPNKFAYADEQTAKLVIVSQTIPKIKDNQCNVFFWEEHVNCVHDTNRKRRKDGTDSQAKCRVLCNCYYHRFARPSVAQGMIPILLTKLLQARKQARKDIEKLDKDDPMRIVLDKRQLAYKVCANSIYGCCGIKGKFAVLPLRVGACTITYRGRLCIQFISNYIPTKYNGKAIYGDTDSVHIQFPHLTSNVDIYNLTDKILADIGTHFPSPMKLEFEKIYDNYLIFTKKRYIATVKDKEGKFIGETLRGIILVRRDNVSVVRRIFRTCVDMIFKREPYEDIISLLNSEILKIFQCCYSTSDFILTKGMNKCITEYKTSATRKPPPHVQVAIKMSNRGINVGVGARIEYVLTTQDKYAKTDNQSSKIQDFELFHKYNDLMKLDYYYYLKKQFVNPLDELFKVAFNKENIMGKIYQTHWNKALLNKQLLDKVGEATITFEE
jgi:DNA polymerase elongation subunit (family B)